MKHAELRRELLTLLFKYNSIFSHWIRVFSELDERRRLALLGKSDRHGILGIPVLGGVWRCGATLQQSKMSMREEPRKWLLLTTECVAWGKGDGFAQIPLVMLMEAEPVIESARRFSERGYFAVREIRLTYATKNYVLNHSDAPKTEILPIKGVSATGLLAILSSVIRGVA